MQQWSEELFRAAVEQAAVGLAEGGVPIGAALGRGDELIAVGRNGRVQHGDAIAHGEIDCLRNAGRLTDYRDTLMYTTLAPCAMCAGAIIQFGIPTVVVGENLTFGGELELLRSRGVEVVLLQDERCQELMTEFQDRYPSVWAEDIGENA